jgi:hypothetical protein
MRCPNEGAVMGTSVQAADRQQFHLRFIVPFVVGFAALMAGTVCGGTNGAAGASESPNGGAHPSVPPGGMGNCVAAQSFSIELPSNVGGWSSPVIVSGWFIRHNVFPGFDRPATGWRVVDRSGSGVTTQSGKTMLHVVRGVDHAWQVDSGVHCR